MTLILIWKKIVLQIADYEGYQSEMIWMKIEKKNLVQIQERVICFFVQLFVSLVVEVVLVEFSFLFYLLLMELWEGLKNYCVF